MPQYLWADKNTGKTCTVIRSFNEYEQPPTEEEHPRSPGEEPADWERQIGGDQALIRGPNWGGAKGYWGKV